MTLLQLLGNFGGVATLGQLDFDHTDFWVTLATLQTFGWFGNFLWVTSCHTDALFPDVAQFCEPDVDLTDSTTLRRFHTNSGGLTIAFLTISARTD